MNYYDNTFRNNLIEMLGNYRKMLSQIEMSGDKGYGNIFVSESIKKVDEAIKIIKPSAFDFLTEKKIEKIQTSEYYKQIEKTTEEKLKEQIRQELEKDYRQKLIDEVKAELEPKIREELKKEREERKAKKKAQKQEESLKKIQTEILNKIQEAFTQAPTATLTENKDVLSSNDTSNEQPKNNDDDDFGDDLEPTPLE